MKVVRGEGTDQLQLCDEPCRTVVLRRGAGVLIVRCRQSPGDAAVIAALSRLDLRGRRAQSTCELKIEGPKVVLLDRHGHRVPLELMPGRWTGRTFDVKPTQHLSLQVHVILPSRQPSMPLGTAPSVAAVLTSGAAGSGPIKGPGDGAEGE